MNDKDDGFNPSAEYLEAAKKKFFKAGGKIKIVIPEPWEVSKFTRYHTTQYEGFPQPRKNDYDY